MKAVSSIWQTIYRRRTSDATPTRIIEIGALNTSHVSGLHTGPRATNQIASRRPTSPMTREVTRPTRAGSKSGCRSSSGTKQVCLRILRGVFYQFSWARTSRSLLEGEGGQVRLADQTELEELAVDVLVYVNLATEDGQGTPLLVSWLI